MDTAQIFADVQYDPDTLQLPVQAVGGAVSDVQQAGIPTRPLSPERFYDDDYFESTSEDEDGGHDSNEATAGTSQSTAGESTIKDKQKRRRKVVPDEDLFYDPAADSDDEEWLKKRINKNRATKGLPPRKQSSPSLACPMCLTPVCHDCQQHDRYEGQFRAMFFENCIVDTEEVQYYPKAGQRSKPPASTANNDGGVQTDDDAFWPVRCEICATQVGVMDAEEVVHFFHVIAG
ncbi:hypothetical protein HDU86_003369 [Geranomyces michiganensis]|nr:hypothetical protein HDU86_003369 [Geranomyces michiganensis]